MSFNPSPFGVNPVGMTTGYGLMIVTVMYAVSLQPYKLIAAKSKINGAKKYFIEELNAMRVMNHFVSIRLDVKTVWSEVIVHSRNS